jgi:hypothetical protein
LVSKLSDVEAGGATVFPAAGARVTPSKGDASFWYNLLPSGKGDLMTRHAGCPVLSGLKWGMLTYSSVPSHKFSSIVLLFVLHYIV